MASEEGLVSNSATILVRYMVLLKYGAMTKILEDKMLFKYLST